jgi:hypothetical protein
MELLPSKERLSRPVVAPRGTPNNPQAKTHWTAVKQFPEKNSFFFAGGRIVEILSPNRTKFSAISYVTGAAPSKFFAAAEGEGARITQWRRHAPNNMRTALLWAALFSRGSSRWDLAALAPPWVMD